MSGQWNNEDKKALATVVVPLIEMQKAYGRKLDMKIILRGWQSLLEDKYTVDQVVRALKQYALERDDFPSPSNIHQILKVKEPRVTYAEYKAALESQRRNGDFSEFSYEASIIHDYNNQEKDSIDKHNELAIGCDDTLLIKGE